MFPYWHMCDVELSRELRYVHSTHGVGVGAFVCQAIEAWDTKLRWSPNKVVGIREGVCFFGGEVC